MSEAKPIGRPAAVTDYRRNFLSGGSCFFTVNLEERRPALLTERIDVLRAAFRRVQAWHPFTIEAAVILPDHLHMIWTLPEGDPDFPLRWRLIKSAFSRRLPDGEWISASRAAKGERGSWQRGIGSTPCVTGTILSGTSITSISIRSNTGMRSVRGIGRIPRFAAGSDSVPIPWIGQPTRR